MLIAKKMYLQAIKTIFITMVKLLVLPEKKEKKEMKILHKECLPNKLL
jgi:hypothetical protein